MSIAKNIIFSQHVIFLLWSHSTREFSYKITSKNSKLNPNHQSHLSVLIFQACVFSSKSRSSELQHHVHIMRHKVLKRHQLSERKLSNFTQYINKKRLINSWHRSLRNFYPKRHRDAVNFSWKRNGWLKIQHEANYTRKRSRDMSTQTLCVVLK